LVLPLLQLPGTDCLVGLPACMVGAGYTRAGRVVWRGYAVAQSQSEALAVMMG